MEVVSVLSAGKVGIKLRRGISFLPEPTYKVDANGNVGLNAVATI